MLLFGVDETSDCDICMRFCNNPQAWKHRAAAKQKTNLQDSGPVRVVSLAMVSLGGRGEGGWLTDVNVLVIKIDLHMLQTGLAGLSLQ